MGRCNSHWKPWHLLPYLGFWFVAALFVLLLPAYCQSLRHTVFRPRKRSVAFIPALRTALSGQEVPMGRLVSKRLPYRQPTLYAVPGSYETIHELMQPTQYSIDTGTHAGAVRANGNPRPFSRSTIRVLGASRSPLSVSPMYLRRSNFASPAHRRHRWACAGQQPQLCSCLQRDLTQADEGLGSSRSFGVSKKLSLSLFDPNYEVRHLAGSTLVR